MGMFDSFTAKVKCEKCQHEFIDDNIQSKDFSCLGDHLKYGEDVRKFTPSFFLYTDSLFEMDKSIKTLDDAIKFQQLNPMKYHLNIYRYDDKTSWGIYEFLGYQQTGFSNLESIEFNCYTSCPKCKQWLDLTGVIKDFQFLGVRPLLLDKGEKHET